MGTRGTSHLQADPAALLPCSWPFLLSRHHQQQCKQLPPRLLCECHPWCQWCGGQLQQHSLWADHNQRGTSGRPQGLSKQEHTSQGPSQENHQLSQTAPLTSPSGRRDVIATTLPEHVCHTPILRPQSYDPHHLHCGLSYCQVLVRAVTCLFPQPPYGLSFFPVAFNW